MTALAGCNLGNYCVLSLKFRTLTLLAAMYCHDIESVVTHRKMKSTYCTAISRSEDIAPVKEHVMIEKKKISTFLASPFSPTRGQTVAQIFFSDGSTFSQDGWWDGALGAAPAVAAVGKLGPSTSTDLYREVNWADPSFKLTTSTRLLCNVQCTPRTGFVKISGNFHQNHDLKRQNQGI